MILLTCSFRCTDEYVRLHYGSTLSGISPYGRICRFPRPYLIFSNILTINYHTDDSDAYPLDVDYTLRGNYIHTVEPLNTQTP
jgi:hypothetical protein